MKLTRQELYARVWSTPMQRLARDLSLSGRGLAKICDRLEVPYPPRGYWRQVECQKRPPKLPLPDPGATTPAEATVGEKKKPSPLNVPETVIDVPVKDRLTSPHTLIHEFRQSIVLRTNDPYAYASRGKSVLNIHMSKSTLPRALRLLDALFKALESRSYSVSLADSGLPACHVKNQKIRIRLRERQTQVRAPLVPGDSPDKYRPISYEPTGDLILSIEDGTFFNIQHTWRDGERRLEECLGDVLASLEMIASELVIYHAELERNRAEEHRREQERWEERRRADELEKQISSCGKAESIRRYIERLQEIARETSHDDLEAWIAWATRYADRIDPLTEVRRMVREGARELVFKVDY